MEQELSAIDHLPKGGFSLEPFKLERYFATHEFSAKYLLCCSDCEPITLQELLATATPESRQLWDELTLAYTESQGHPLLLHQIAKLYTEVRTDQIAVMAPQEAIFLSMLALLSPGDHVICTFPGYQSLYEVAKAVGCEVSYWGVQEGVDGSLVFNVADLLSMLRQPTKLVVVNFPHNPTGILPSHADWAAIVAGCRSSDAHLFSDEMYRTLEARPEDRLVSACDAYEKGITLSGLSKAWGCPGLRIGWLATRDAAILKRVLELKDYTTICNGALSEIAGIMALQATAQIVARNRATIAENVAAANDFFSARTDKFAWHPPTAGSIGFPCLLTGEPIDAYCARLLKAAGVLLLPATVYDHPASIVENRFRIGLGRKNFGECMQKWVEFDANEVPYVQGA